MEAITLHQQIINAIEDEPTPKAKHDDVLGKIEKLSCAMMSAASAALEPREAMTWNFAKRDKTKRLFEERQAAYDAGNAQGV